MTTLIPRLPRLPRRQRRGRARMSPRRIAVIAASALLVLSGCGYGVQRLLSYFANVRATQAIADATCMNAGATIVMHEGAARECVGITDGAYPLIKGNPAFAGVLSKIRLEDQWVDRQADKGAVYVSVAYLLPISATGAGVEPVSTQAEQLQGAYTAQWYANRHNLQGTRPLIKLLVASSGTQAAQWRHSDQFIEQDVTSQHLVAVAGIGVSLATTIAEVKQLTRDGIPVFASSITSDKFDNITNMVRVVPGNAQDVSAILKFVWPEASSAILIEDTNQTDSYDETLVHEFHDGFAGDGHSILETLSYDTTGEVSTTDKIGQQVGSTIGQMITNICTSSAHLVLFAGRGQELAELFSDLSTSCQTTTPITIVTGDDVTDMPPVSQAPTNVTLYYAGEASPAEWQQGSGPLFANGQRGFAQFLHAFTTQFPGVLDNDGDAMIGYDAMLTSITAIRLAGPESPSPGAVIRKLSLLQGSGQVLGASGPIDLAADYTLSTVGSNPVNKVVPILRWSPSRIEFVTLEN
jgi:hypothetical protein